MKYAYKGVTGTTEIEVDELLHDTLVAMDREEYNSDRKHSRRHPVSLDEADYEGEWFEDGTATDEIDAVIDMERAMTSLTNFQWVCFTETKLNGKSQRKVAAELGKSRSTVQHAVDGAIEILKKFY